ncbi:MAG: T9SS type A sorting domain-containing protein [Prevotella sp.]
MRRFILTISFLITLSFALPFMSEARANAMIEISDVEAPTMEITVHSSVVKVHVTGAKGQTLMIYNVAGVCVEVKKIDSDDRSFEFSLPKGCYIAKVGNKAKKISVNK